MKKVLLDTNIVLDIALKRMPYFNEAARLFELIDANKIVAHISATTITDIYYIAKREKGHDRALEFVIGLLEVVDILGIDKDVILSALLLNMKDFEDSIQVSAAEINSMDCLITRNERDFADSPVQVYNPLMFLHTFE